ncbi:MAG: hypothetical protein QGH66_08800 [Dehalococcoidia bacterium]|nr:hypothetical protein [Dehalococcoidia bacterium]
MDTLGKKCTHCREDLEEDFVEYRGKAYCCSTCAFETSLKLGSMCGSRSSVEAGMRFIRAQHPAPTDP